MTIEFQAWPKTPRLFRDVVITEKIDGTNACVIIREIPDGEECSENAVAEVKDESAAFDTYYEVGAQSRNRVITPAADNAGFARWVRDNARELVATLGVGYHYGEWWGVGIQRGYGLRERRFSLFNTARWTTEEGIQALEKVDGLYPVPVLYEGVFSEKELRDVIQELRDFGSPATELKFANPEGVCVFHTQSRQVYKVLLENDDRPKSA